MAKRIHKKPIGQEAHCVAGDTCRKMSSLQAGRFYFANSLLLLLCVLFFTACSGSATAEQEKLPTERERVKVEETAPEKEPRTAEKESDAAGKESDAAEKENSTEPEITDADWAKYFDGLNGAAVFYTPSDKQYMIYNYDLANERRSPCSTFKIISSLVGLEKGVIPMDNSVRKWSGETFWNENWNKDIGFQEAFATSCIWYFRQVIDELGPEIMQEELNKLQYGNCDSSDWDGQLHHANQNPSLTGFWLTSLKISAKEQTEVMERIFDGKIPYQTETLERLKQAMLVADQEQSANPVYGKTGTGSTDGTVVDAWFTGFVETQDGNVYFSVYLGRTDGRDVTSAVAKEIAIQIASDSLKTGYR